MVHVSQRRDYEYIVEAADEDSAMDATIMAAGVHLADPRPA